MLCEKFMFGSVIFWSKVTYVKKEDQNAFLNITYHETSQCLFALHLIKYNLCMIKRKQLPGHYIHKVYIFRSFIIHDYDQKE